MQTRFPSRLAHSVLIAAALTGLFVIYRITAPPGLTWQHGGVDGGELALASAHLGVAHPPGYVLYTLIGALFTHLPLPVHPIVRLQMMSHLLACLAVLATGYAAWHVSVRWHLPSPVLAGWLAAGSLGLNRLFWSQAIIVEVYSLLILFFALQLVISLRCYQKTGRWQFALLCGFAQGMAISHHLSAVLWLPGLMCWWGWRRWPVITAGMLMGLWPVVVMTLLAGHDPAANWGGVQLSAQHLINHITASQYRVYLTPLSPMFVLQRAGDWIGHLVAGFTPFGAAMLLLGLILLVRCLKRLWVSMLLWWIALMVFTAQYTARDTANVYAAPLLVIVVLWIALGTAQLLARFPFQKLGTMGIPAFYTLMLLTSNFPAVDLSYDREPEIFLAETLAAVPSGSIVLTNSDEETFTLWYYQYVETVFVDRTIVDRRLWQYDWYRANLQQLDPALPVDVDQPDRWLSDSRLAGRPIVSSTFMLPAGGRSVSRAGHWYISPTSDAQPPESD